MSANEQIAVERFGSGPAVLFLHGGDGPELTWERQMQLAQRWSLIVPTGREADAEDLGRLLTKRTHLVAFSSGGIVVTEAAMQNPKMVRTLTLIDPPTGLTREQAADLEVLAGTGIPIMLVSSGRDPGIESAGDDLANRLRARREVVQGDGEIVPRSAGFNDVLEDFLRGSAGTARFRTA